MNNKDLLDHTILERYRLEQEDSINILDIDNTVVRKQQVERLNQLKVGCDNETLKKVLEAITCCVETKQGNLLELSIEAAQVRATLGEISDACEKIVGRYNAVIRTISGVYSAESKEVPILEKTRELTDRFAKKERRRPRIMVAKKVNPGSSITQSACDIMRVLMDE